MPSAPAFEFTSRELAQRTNLEPIEARGTLRIALKAAGLEATTVTPEQMAVVLRKVMPAELEKRGIDGADATCERIRTGVLALDQSAPQATPESVFDRLGGLR